MQQKQDYIRAFIAISLPDHVKLFLRDLQKELKRSDVRGSYPRPESAHLTLRFLGQIHDDQIPDVCACMTQSIRFFKDPIKLHSTGIGVFPSVKNARVMWAGIGGRTDLLENMVREINNLLQKQLELETDKRRFSPHLTLCRVKHRLAPQKTIDLMQHLGARQSEEFFVSDIHLFKSKLQPSGAVHTKIFTASV